MTRLLADYTAMLADGLRTVLRARGPQRWRRLGFLVILLTVYPAWVAFTSLCLLLDPLIAPGVLDEPLPAPVFILGNHRTGSTFLHRLLAVDEETFATARLWDLLLPSLLQKRVLGVMERLDAALGGTGRRLITWADARWMNDYRQVHPMGIWLPEEDEYFLFYRLQSAALWECFPRVKRLRRLFWSDTEMAPDELDGAMGFYRRMAQRHRRARGGATWLSKNPLFSARVSGLRRAFPDARFVVLVRDPRRVVPSTASLLHHALRGVGALSDTEQEMALIHEICDRFYDEPLAQLEGLPPERLVVVRYEELRADLVGTVEGFLTQIGVPVTPKLHEALVASTREGYRKTHSYQLEDWGLSEEEMKARYADVMAQYNY